LAERFFDCAQLGARRARATGAEFVLFIDADETLEWPAGAPSLREMPLELDAYAITTHVDHEHGVESFNRIRLVRAAMPCRWTGALHQQLLPDAPVTSALLARAHLRNRNDGASCADPNKAAKRVQLLERMTQSEPANGHAWMMLGQELTNAGRLCEAIAAYEGCTSVAETTRRASSHSSASRRL
jgi:hypothetical protein